MRARGEKTMKTQLLVGVVVALHIAAVGTLVVVQGCGTAQPSVEPPPAPVMPPPPAVEPGENTLPDNLKPAPAPTVPVAETKIGSYTVQNGDSLSKIAHRFKVSQRELAELNNIKNANKLRVGQTLKVPGAPAAVTAPAPVKPTVKKPVAKPVAKPAAPSVPLTAGGEYVVQSGDYLGKIAAKHGVKIRDIRAINKLKSDALRPGQKLIIPAGGKTAVEPVVTPPTVPEVPPAPPVTPEIVPPTLPPPAAPTGDAVTAPPAPPAPEAPALTGGPKPISYPVSAGETVETIAKAFLISPESVRALNNLAPDAQPKPGQTLLVPIH